MKHSKRNRFAIGIRCLLCLLVVLSFTAPLISIVSASSSDMPCCAGKAHCDSGIAPKQVLPPTSEPMCGLKGATMEDDGITIVAQPSQTESPHHSHSRTAGTSSTQPAAESASLSKPCRMDCGACLTGSTRTPTRERALLQTVALRLSSQATPDRFNYLSLLVSSNYDWKQTSPRGPPSDLL